MLTAKVISVTQLVSGIKLKNKINITTAILLTLFVSAFTFGQDEMNDQIQFTGSLHADSKIIMNSYSELQSKPMADDMPTKKSPVLAGVLSAIIPGAGQIYNEDYWVAAAFVVVEAALVTTAIVYDNKGDDQTEYYEGYADENWSVVRYAEWLNEYQNAEIDIDYDTPGLQPWERVNWNELNSYETGSHKLAPYGEQQYYEMIGKYHQFSAGWNDYTGGPNNALISPNFEYYSIQRGEANDYYNTASTAIVGIYINHLLAAAEAVWGAARFNNNLTVNLRVEPYNFATGTQLIPTLKMKLSF